MDVTRDQRIAVESLNAWEQTKEDFAMTARAKLDERLKARGIKSKEQRQALYAHLNHFIEQTMGLAQPNLRVNGRNFEDVDEDQDQFDEALDRKIWSLADSRLALHKDLSKTRRTVPREIENKLTELFGQQRALDEQGDVYEGMPDELPEDNDALVQRSSDIQDTFRKTVALAEELNQVVSNQQERAERYEIVSTEIKSLPP